MTSHPKMLRPWKACGLLAAGLLLAAAAPARAQTHLDNPFVGARMYVNPDYTANADATAAATADPTLAAAMRAAGRQPTAIWLDRIAAVPSLATHLDRALAAGNDLVLVVLYDLPSRNCGALISDGELQLEGGLARYKAEFIDAIASIASKPQYAGIRIVAVVEPKSLAYLVTGGPTPSCAAVDSSGVYVSGIRYAVNTLHAIPNVYLYVDLAYSAWLGWTNNAPQAVNLMNNVAGGFTAGKSAIDGFATNVAEYVPLKEPYFTATTTIAGQQVWTSRFYDWNPMIEETTYASDMHAKLVAAGWPSTLGMIIDTSRNGWGGPPRPTGPSPQVGNLEQFVTDSKLDRRAHRELWCNVAGAGLGERPQATPPTFAPMPIDAFVWVKPPGESDGASSDIPNDEGKWFDRMCDPTYSTQYGVLTGALPNAPLFGKWFPAQFAQLVQNAWPAPTVDPVFYILSVTSNAGGRVTSTPAGIDCGAYCDAAFQQGTAVTLTATSGSAPFLGWTGACSGLTTPTCVVSMTQARTVGTTFGGAYVLTVERAGTGLGTVTSTAGINCGAACSAALSPGSAVTLTASAASGSSFAGWSGACTGVSSTCVVAMTAARQVTASFNSGTWYPLTVSIREENVCNPPPGCRPGSICDTACYGGGGSVSSVPAGLSCSWPNMTCGAAYEGGATVTLVATAASPNVFGGWNGACSGMSPSCAVSMSQAQAVAARFLGKSSQILHVATGGTGTGKVTGAGGWVDCATSCDVPFSTGETLTLTASAAAGSVFTGWSGACTGIDLTCTVSMAQAQTVTATFTANVTYPLRVTKSGTGTGTVTSTPAGIQCGTTCTATLGGNAVVTLTATAATGSTFAGWSGACTGTALTCTVVMSAARDVTAIFMSGLPTLTIVKTGTGSGTVTSSSGGINCGMACSAAFQYGARVTLTVAPAAGSRFVSMSGCTDGGSCDGPVDMTKSRVVTVVFEAVTPMTPCANPITFSWNTGNFNTAGAVCYRTSQTVNGWGCSNFAGRTVGVNALAPTATCGAGPLPLAKHTDGYTYFTVTAGQYPWASLYAW